MQIHQNASIILPNFTASYLPVTKFDCSTISGGAHNSVVNWGTKPQVGNSWIWLPMRSLDFFQLT
jgi:hypothetical protein